MLGKEWSRAKILTVKVVNIAAIAVCWAFVLLCIYVVLSVLVFSTFRVPTESMEPTLKPGDNFGSDDSRYWGLLPEEFIVGKAWLIWHSVDLPTGKIRWKRCFRIVR